MDRRGSMLQRASTKPARPDIKPDTAALEKEGWVSLQDAHGMARAVKAALTQNTFALYSLKASAKNRKTSDQSTGSKQNNMGIAHRSIDGPHPDRASDEGAAHDLLFGNVTDFDAHVLAAPVSEVAQYAAEYLDLLAAKALGQLGEPELARCAHNVHEYCQAVTRFPAIVGNPAALHAVLRLASALTAIDAQLAEQLKVMLARAQQQTAQQTERAFTPKTTTSSPTSSSPFAPTLLKLAQSTHGLPPSLLLEPGFAREFAHQIAAFHRRLWREWSPVDDLSLLFHTNKSSAAWQKNPLVFDSTHPHFLSLLLSQHMLSVQVPVETRAKLVDQWITIAKLLYEQGDGVGWIAILAALFQTPILRLDEVWDRVSVLGQVVSSEDLESWAYELFELHKRAKKPFLEKRTLRIGSQQTGKLFTKEDSVPYFGDAFITSSENTGGQLARVRVVIQSWHEYLKTMEKNEDSSQKTQVTEDPAFQCLFAVWAQQPTTPLDVASLSLAMKPRLLGHYLAHFRSQQLPLPNGGMLPVLFTRVAPNFRLFPRQTLLAASAERHASSSQKMIRRSSSFPPAGPPLTTGFKELDVGAREQLENTASAHVLAKSVRDLLNVGTETIDDGDIVFKCFSEDEPDRTSRTSSLIENLNLRRQSFPRASSRAVVVKSASMTRLVDALVLDASAFGHNLRLDLDTHVATLLAAFRSFCAPLQLLEMLTTRVLGARHASKGQLWTQSTPEEEADELAVRIVTAVIGALGHWVAHYFFDFQDDATVMAAGLGLVIALNTEVDMYPESVVTRFHRVKRLFLRKQYSICRHAVSPEPSWYKAIPNSPPSIPDFPVTNLDPEGGVPQINLMIDELDTLVADAFSRITMPDWMKLFEVLEQQTVTPTGLYSYRTLPFTSENDVVIQDVYSWLRTLRDPATNKNVVDLLPAPIVALLRLHTGIVSYFASQIADPTLLHTHERVERMEFVLKLLGVLRSRMQHLNLSVVGWSASKQNVPSFLEQAVIAAIMKPESRAYPVAWLTAGKNIAHRWSPDANSDGRDQQVPNLNNLFVPTIPLQEAKPTTICIGWIIERLLEIVCCIPNLTVDKPDLINFDKYRYAFNLICNMAHTAEPVVTPAALAKKYQHILGESEIDHRLHKESVAKQGKTKHRVFMAVVAEEMARNKEEANMYEKLERATSAAQAQAEAPGKGFYGLPASQSSTSLSSKRISRLIPSISSADISSYLDSSSTTSTTTTNAVPTERKSSQRKSRLGGFLRSVRPLSVLGSSPNPLGNHSNGSNSSLNSTASPLGSPPKDSMPPAAAAAAATAPPQHDDGESLVPDSTINLSALPVLEQYTADDFSLISQTSLDNVQNVELAKSSFLLITHRTGPKPETITLRCSSAESTQDWYAKLEYTMERKYMASTKVFGVPLGLVARREQRPIPQFFESLLHEIEERGLDEVGIYRISGSLGAIQAMKQWFDEGNPSPKVGDPRWSDVNAIAGCIKMYLRDLPQPLMTTPLLPQFKAAVRGTNDVDLPAFRKVLQQLPQPNYETLKRIARHLQIVVAHSDENKMGIQNIAIVFSVNFLPPVAMADLGAMQHLVTSLVQDYDYIFN